MKKSFDQLAQKYAQVPELAFIDLCTTFCEGQPGRQEKSVIDRHGKKRLDSQAWMAGDIAYQALKERFPQGITVPEFSACAAEANALVCDDFYPSLLRRVDAGEITLAPPGRDGLVKGWEEADWSGRIMVLIQFIDSGNQDFGNDVDLKYLFDLMIALVLLQRLDDAVLSQFADGSGLADVMLDIASLRDRLQPPKHVQMAINRLQGNLDTFVQARRKGADAIHAEHRSMKADVFKWLDTNNTGGKNFDDIALLIAGKVVPLKFRTVRGYITEWNKLRSASRP